MSLELVNPPESCNMHALNELETRTNQSKIKCF